MSEEVTSKLSIYSPPEFQGDLYTYEQVRDAIRSYFEYCDEREISYTISGLAHFLRLSDKSLLSTEGEVSKKYTLEPPETIELFQQISVQRLLRQARLRIESQRSAQLLDDPQNTQAKIFDLKVNHGWQDKQSVQFSNPDGNMSNKVAVVLPGQPGALDMDQWQAMYDQMIRGGSSNALESGEGEDEEQ